MMKRLMFLILSLAVLVGMGLATTAAVAGEGVFGSMEWRWEGYKDLDHNSDADDAWAEGLLRSRLGYKTMISDRGFFKMSMENLRVLGGDWRFGSSTKVEYFPLASPVWDDDEIFVREAYFGMKDLFFDGFTGQVGRFGLNFGRERVFGTNDWSLHSVNYWDGFKGSYKFDSGWLALLCLQANEVGPTKWTTGEGDTNIYGAYLHYDFDENMWLEPYVLMGRTGHVDFGAVEGWDADSEFWFGALFDYTTDNGLHFYAEGMMQSGTENFMPPADPESMDKSAMGFYAGLFYTVDNEMEPYFGAEFNYASGTAYDEMEEDNTFVSPFGSSYSYLGRMGMVDWSDVSAIRLAGGFTPTENLDVSVDFFMFSLAEDYAEDAESDIGNEIDLILNYNVEEGIDFEGGVAIFSYGDAWGFAESEIPDDSTWYAWMGAKVAFPTN